MKRILVACFLALALFSQSGKAHAQIPVTDIAAAAQRVQSLFNQAAQIANEAKSIANQVMEYKMLIQQYEQMVQTTTALAHSTDIVGLLSQLGSFGRMPLPDGSTIPELMQGQGLWGRANQFLGRMQSYTSPRPDIVWNEMQREANVTANIQAFAAASNISVDQHMENLRILQARLAAAKDITEVEAIRGASDLELHQIELEKGQLQTAYFQMAADDRVKWQKVEQGYRKGADTLFSIYPPVTGSIQ